MDILKVIRHTDGGDKYLENGVNYNFKEKTEVGEKLVETVGYGVSGTKSKPSPRSDVCSKGILR